MPISVSVVIPSYNSEAWIEDTLGSVIAQVHPTELLEIIVVDDVSPDNTVARARQFLSGRSIKNQVVVREKNGGPGAGRNVGWKLASHDWVQFLDGDDLIAPPKLALQTEMLARCGDEVDVAYSNWQAYALHEGTWQGYGTVWKPFVDDKPVLRILQELQFGYVGPTLIRKSMLERVAGFGEAPNLGEDIDLMLRMAMAGARFRQVPTDRVAFYYRQSPNSLASNYGKKIPARRNLLETFRRAEEHLRKLAPNGELAEDERIALSYRYSRDAEFFVEHDPETYGMVKGWLARLGESRPTALSRNLRLLSTLVGYENAVRLRAAYRRTAGRVPRAGSSAK